MGPVLSWSHSAFHRELLSLQGAHVTINARAEEDVEPECIMQKVARASGANYTFHRESSRFQDTGPQAPVVSAAWAQEQWAGVQFPASRMAASVLSTRSLTGLAPTCLASSP